MIKLLFLVGVSNKWSTSSEDEDNDGIELTTVSQSHVSDGKSAEVKKTVEVKKKSMSPYSEKSRRLDICIAELKIHK